MPTLGEFITHARAYGYTRHVIRLRELQARIVESLCDRAEIPTEDFGL